MAIDYTNLLTPEQKRNIIAQRLTQFAATAYQHEINLRVAEATGDENLANESNAALAELEKAINVHEAERDSLPAEEPAPTE